MQQFVFELNESENYSNEDYIVSVSNQAAIQTINNWPNWGNRLYHNILLIYGVEGCGKTHLSHIWQRKSNAKFLSKLAFYQYSPNELLDRTDCYIIEDFEEWIDLEIKLLHLLNLIIEKKKFLLITMNTRPRAISIKLLDLSSRLYSFPNIEISAPDDELLSKILLKYFADRHLRVNTQIINYMLPRIERSFANLKKFVEALDKKSLVEKRNITIPLIKEVLDYIDYENKYHAQ
ncbi:MAG: HdaA/DnaA family protein [Alphaproteobacteria bacterium]